jgi:hypothetical protein
MNGKMFYANIHSYLNIRNVVKIIECIDVSVFTLILTVSSKQTTVIDHFDNKDLPPTYSKPYTN